MRKYLFIPFLLGAALLQTTVLARLTVSDAKLDLMVMLVVAETVFGGVRTGMIWGFVGGLFLDLLSGVPFGSLTLVLSLVAFVAGLATGESLRHRFLLPLVLVFVTSLLEGGLLVLSLQLADRPVFWNTSLVSAVVQGATFNTALMPLVYLAFNRWRPRARRFEEPSWSLT